MEIFKNQKKKKAFKSGAWNQAICIKYKHQHSKKNLTSKKYEQRRRRRKGGGGDDKTCSKALDCFWENKFEYYWKMIKIQFQHIYKR